MGANSSVRGRPPGSPERIPSAESSRVLVPERGIRAGWAPRASGRTPAGTSMGVTRAKDTPGCNGTPACPPSSPRASCAKS